MAIPSFNAVVLVYLGAVLAIWVRRVIWIAGVKRDNKPLVPVAFPSISESVTVVVPAKNEEKNIENCLTHLFRQNYKHYDLLVIDDRSDDKTPDILARMKPLSPVPMKVVRIEKLPEGWTGKNHGMHTASKAASGKWMLFTDADTTHKRESIATALECAAHENIDFLTLGPETESRSFWEKTVQPLAVSCLALWFDPARINDPKKRALANGQFILIRKDVYEKVGGNEAIKDQVVEDVELAKRVREAGFNVRFLNGTTLYATRMYSSLKEIKNGWTRIFIHLFERNIPAILYRVFQFTFLSILPFVVLAAAASGTFGPLALVLSLAACGFIVTVRFIGNRIVKTNPWYGFLHPLGAVVLIWILLICVWRIAFNRPSEWRGSFYK